MTKQPSDETSPEPFPEGLAERAREVWLAGLGALSAAEKQGIQIYQELIERGKALEKQGRPRVEEAADRARDASREARDRLETLLAETTELALKRAGVPSNEEVEALSKKVDALTAKVEALTALLKEEQEK